MLTKSMSMADFCLLTYDDLLVREKVTDILQQIGPVIDFSKNDDFFRVAAPIVRCRDPKDHREREKLVWMVFVLTKLVEVGVLVYDT